MSEGHAAGRGAAMQERDSRDMAGFGRRVGLGRAVQTMQAHLALDWAYCTPRYRHTTPQHLL